MMPGYRLTFGVQHLRANDMADALVAASDTVGEVVSSLSEFAAAEFQSHDFLTSLMASQIIVRFTAPSDETAYLAAEHALRSVSLPLDGEKIERRSRRYVPIGA